VILKPWWNILWIHQSKHDIWGWYPQDGKITFLWEWNSTAVLLIFNLLRWQTQTDDWTYHARNGFIMVYYCKISRPRKKEERFCTNNFKPRYLICIFRLVSTPNPLTVQSTWSNCMLAKIYAHKTTMCVSEQTCSFGILPVRNQVLLLSFLSPCLPSSYSCTRGCFGRRRKSCANNTQQCFNGISWQVLSDFHSCFYSTIRHLEISF